MGIGTFSQFENCLRECLERERRMTGMASHITRHDLPPNASVHDYGYDYVPSVPSYNNNFNPATVHTFTDYPSRPLSSFAIDDVRYINAALSRRGIPLFPYHEAYDDSYYCSTSSAIPPPAHRTGEVVSACQVVEEDPAIMCSGDRLRAVQNVWNAIRNCPPLPHVDHSRSGVSSRGLYDF